LTTSRGGIRLAPLAWGTAARSLSVTIVPEDAIRKESPGHEVPPSAVPPASLPPRSRCLGALDFRLAAARPGALRRRQAGGFRRGDGQDPQGLERPGDRRRH